MQKCELGSFSLWLHLKTKFSFPLFKEIPYRELKEPKALNLYFIPRGEKCFLNCQKSFKFNLNCKSNVKQIEIFCIRPLSDINIVPARTYALFPVKKGMHRKASGASQF